VSGLGDKRCVPCEGGVPALDAQAARRLMTQIDPAWTLQGDEIARDFEFRSYRETIAFVNAVAWIAEREGHHPDLEVGYRKCRVRYTTHAIKGLSENDFICAAKVDALVG
jgi:4a-hydroxytetrahydrobiopterin dehydratase